MLFKLLPELLVLEHWCFYLKTRMYCELQHGLTHIEVGRAHQIVQIESHY